ncbi:MAG: PhoH family protein [bacterium]|nr:PhoH family protein [bacterium]
MTHEKSLPIDSGLALPLLGPRDQHLRSVAEQTGVDITHRNGELRILGEEAENVEKGFQAFVRLYDMVQRRGIVSADDVARVLAQVTGNDALIPKRPIDIVHSTKSVKPRTPGQSRYVEAIRGHDLVFAAGPAGTGKTYLAVAMAVEGLKHRTIRRIVLVRPAVEAGESLGFLPGDMIAKINPYLRPLLDALHDMMDYDEVKRAMEEGVIEVAPLAYMRGRTLNDAFIILDEAQNTTVAQMKMFLTRMGEGSKIVVSGDATQLDLPAGVKSGMIDAVSRLASIRGVSVVELTASDIVRHRLVQDIVNAYERPAARPSSRRSG